MLEAERAFYRDRCDEWCGEHEGEYVLVKGEELVGFFNEESEALAEGARRFGDDDFLVRRVDGTDRREVRAPALSLGILQAGNVEPTGDQ